MPLSEDEVSLGDEEFIVPEDPVEQEHFKRRLIARANSLKKKQQQLRADKDLLADRWTEVLAAEEYELERPTKNCWKYALEAIINWLLLYFLVHDNRLLSMLELY